MHKILFRFFFLGMLLFAAQSEALTAQFDHFWKGINQDNLKTIDHSIWDRFLRNYVVENKGNGLNLVAYKSVSKLDRKELRHYLSKMERIQVWDYNKLEQRAYWINLYNALVVNLVLTHPYALDMRDIQLPGKLFSYGPYDAKLVQIYGNKISLNDIRNKILRPYWREQRIHYVLCDGSRGAPNLQPVAFTSKNIDSLMEKATKEFINRPFNIYFADTELYVPFLYKWYKEDFDHTDVGVLHHIRRHTSLKLRNMIALYRGRVRYQHDWHINSYE